MEQAVRESEARLTAFMEHAPIAMYLKDFEGRYVLTNPEMSKLFARPVEEMIGLSAADAGVRLDLDMVVERDREILRSGRSTVYEEQVPELDAYRWSLVIRFPVRNGAGAVTHIGGFHVDISRTKEFEQLLKQSEQRFRTIAEAHPVPMVIVSVPEFDVLFANAAFQELFRLTPARLAATDTAELYADPADGDRVRGLIAERGRLDDFEVELRRADGTVLPASLSSRLIEYESRPAIVTSVTDLTKIKHAETEIARQREALHQSEKLSALGTLLAGVAHELNNPLSVVVGQAILLEDFAEDPAAKSRAVKIRAAAERCARIVRTFLAMARKRPSERGPVDVNEALEAALELLGYGLRTADVRVARDLAADLPPVWGDSDQLHQVLTNLIINAQHALQNVDPPRELRLATSREGDLVRIEVEDSGPGIDQTLAKRIFEPFFTTKPTGTGIGLSVCHGIVGAHDGSIELVSRPGSGACFVVRLPLRLDEGRTQAGSAGEAAGQLTARILLVDDEVEVADLYAEVLRRQGHEVLVAGSGQAALAVVESTPIDLIVSDLRMPDIDGPALYRALSDAGSVLASRIIFVTGDTLSEQAERFLAETGADVLEKPLEPRELVARVRATLSARV